MILRMGKVENMKILYLMWIDWRWIWQRPQILASKLVSKYDITVLFPQNIISRQKMQKNPYPDQYKKAYVVPFYDKNSVLQKVMDGVIRWCMRDVQKYDVVWAGHPLFEKFIPSNYTGRIIYDCMDNHAALSGSAAKGAIVDAEEKRLVSRSSLVFATSSLLKEKIEKYVTRPETKVVLVRNGYDFKDLYSVSRGEKKAGYKLGYIGTISEWMDYPSIIQSIAECCNIEYHLIGLVSGNNYVKKERLFYEGVVEHNALYDKIKDYDCLVMPFVVNEIVLSVDPVKLYEYISFGKCIISVYYPEIERFGEFVYFYHTSEEYCELIKRLASHGFPPKYSEESQRKFLQENTWEKRFEKITESIGK